MRGEHFQTRRFAEKQKRKGSRDGNRKGSTDEAWRKKKVTKPWKKNDRKDRRPRPSKVDADQLDRQLESYWGRDKDGENFKNFQENKKKGLDNDLDSYWTNKHPTESKPTQEQTSPLRQTEVEL